MVASVGGTALLVRADLHRSGLLFPTDSHRGYIETEGLAAMACDMGHLCWGMPQLRITHAYDEEATAAPSRKRVPATAPCAPEY